MSQKLFFFELGFNKSKSLFRTATKETHELTNKTKTNTRMCIRFPTKKLDFWMRLDVLAATCLISHFFRTCSADALASQVSAAWTIITCFPSIHSGFDKSRTHFFRTATRITRTNQHTRKNKIQKNSDVYSFSYRKTRLLDALGHLGSYVSASRVLWIPDLVSTCILTDLTGSSSRPKKP